MRSSSTCPLDLAFAWVTRVRSKPRHLLYWQSWCRSAENLATLANCLLQVSEFHCSHSCLVWECHPYVPRWCLWFPGFKEGREGGHQSQMSCLRLASLLQAWGCWPGLWFLKFFTTIRVETVSWENLESLRETSCQQRCKSDRFAVKVSFIPHRFKTICSLLLVIRRFV